MLDTPLFLITDNTVKYTPIQNTAQISLEFASINNGIQT